MYTSLLCSIIPLVSLLFAVLVSLHPDTFLMFFITCNNTAVPGVHNNVAVPEAHNNAAVPEAHNNAAVHGVHNNAAIPEAHNNAAVPEAHNNAAVPGVHNSAAAYLILGMGCGPLRQALHESRCISLYSGTRGGMKNWTKRTVTSRKLPPVLRMLLRVLAMRRQTILH